MASSVMLKVTILLRISHLGMKPVKGGSPVRDRVEKSIVNIRCGEDVHMVAKSLIVDDDEKLNIRKIGVVVVT